MQLNLLYYLFKAQILDIFPESNALPAGCNSNREKLCTKVLKIVFFSNAGSNEEGVSTN